MENHYSKLSLNKTKPVGYGKKHFLELPMNALVIGPTGSGKTNSVLNIIKALNGNFSKIVLCTADFSSDPLYVKLKSKVGDAMEIHENGEIPPLSSLETDGENWLMIFDDIVNNKEANREIENYAKRARKLGISWVYLTQSFYRTPKFIREQVKYIFIRKLKTAGDLRRILSEFPLDVDLVTLKRMYAYSTKEFTDLMLIDTIIDKVYKNLIQDLTRNG